MARPFRFASFLAARPPLMEERGLRSARLIPPKTNGSRLGDRHPGTPPGAFRRIRPLCDRFPMFQCPLGLTQRPCCRTESGYVPIRWTTGRPVVVDAANNLGGSGVFPRLFFAGKDATFSLFLPPAPFHPTVRTPTPRGGSVAAGPRKLFRILERQQRCHGGNRSSNGRTGDVLSQVPVFLLSLGAAGISIRTWGIVNGSPPPSAVPPVEKC